MKTAVVCGAGGFIGSHLVRRLKKEGYWVRGADLNRPEFARTAADEFLKLDLRLQKNCLKAVAMDDGAVDEVYQLAADMGGMGFIHSAECEIMYTKVCIIGLTAPSKPRANSASFYLDSVNTIIGTLITAC